MDEQTTPGQDRRDPVEELRQRMRRAVKVLDTVTATTGNIRSALENALAALERAMALKSWIASDPAVRAVARELVGEGVTYTEWCWFEGIEDPNACQQIRRTRPGPQLWPYDERAEAESMLRSYGSGGIAQRQVTVYHTPWQVVDTEGGDQP